MPQVSITTYADLNAALERVGAKMKAWEVHALYLGALTSTNFRVGPHRLLDRILGEEAAIGESAEDVNVALMPILGYWNHIVSEREAGRVHLAPFALAETAGMDEMIAFAQRRHDELLLFVRGIDSGGDDPFEFGTEGQELLTKLAEGSGFLAKYVEMLGRETVMSATELGKTRETLVRLVVTVEGLITDLMAVSDAVRREAVDTFAAQAGRETDDGVPIAAPPRVGRHDLCPCGSGQKWKKCCGSPERMQ